MYTSTGATRSIATVGVGHANATQTRGIQYLLWEKGIDTGWEATWGSRTTTGVRAWQARAGLPQTGAVDERTFTSLLGTVTKGTRSYRVFAFQTLAKQHSFAFKSGGSGSTMPMPFEFGLNETNTLNAMQGRYGLGYATTVYYAVWRTLLMPPTKAVPTVTVRAPVQSSSAPNRYSKNFPTLGKGRASFAQTRAVQYLLLTHGVAMPWESTWGEATETAVQASQGRKRMPTSGVADERLLTALTGTLAKGTTSYRTFAVQTLLNAHGYAFNATGNAAVKMSTYYGPSTDWTSRSFYTGHALSYSGRIEINGWRTLFSPKTSGPMYSILQQGTGAAQWANCGPTSALTVLLAEGKKVSGWNGTHASRANAVPYVRYTLMGVANTTERNQGGHRVPGYGQGLLDDEPASPAARQRGVGGDDERSCR